MFANHPIGFIVSVALCLAGVGIIIFMVWYIRCPGATLTITNEQTTLRKGLLSKFTNNSLHENVRNIIVQQTLLLHIFGVGSIRISSAGQSKIEIEVYGIPDPDWLKQIVDDRRG